VRHTLWSKGQLLGSIRPFPDGAAVPGISPNSLIGLFDPSDAFATRAAPLAMMASISNHEHLQLFDATLLPRPSELECLPQGEAARLIQTALRAAVEFSPDLQRILALRQSIDDLELELRDDTDARITAMNISLVSMVAESGLPWRDLLHDAGAGASEYVLIARLDSTLLGAAPTSA
jgi:hypothetical protein